MNIKIQWGGSHKESSLLLHWDSGLLEQLSTDSNESQAAVRRLLDVGLIIDKELAIILFWAHGIRLSYSHVRYYLTTHALEVHELVIRLNQRTITEILGQIKAELSRVLDFLSRVIPHNL